MAASVLPSALPDAFVGKLRDLVVVCRDGEEGYRHAAHRVHDRGLREAFTRRSHRRASFVRDLRHSLLLHGHDGTDRGSAMASLHRHWLRAKVAFRQGQLRAILEECERGERAALAAYERALVHRDLPEHLLPLLEAQWSDVFDACARFAWLAQPPTPLLPGAPDTAATRAWARLVDRGCFWEMKLEIEACLCRRPEQVDALLERLGLESLVHWRLVEEEVHRHSSQDPIMESIGRQVSHARLMRLRESELPRASPPSRWPRERR